MQCPQCRVEIEDKATSCFCGWVADKNKVDQARINNLHRCRYQTKERQCEMIGTISPNDRGTEKNYYCRWHFLNLNDPKRANDYQEFKKWQEPQNREYQEGSPIIKLIKKDQFIGDPNKIWVRMTGYYGEKPTGGKNG